MPPDLRPFTTGGKKIICTRTFSKIYGLASLRIGYGYACKELIEILQKTRQPFNVNALAQIAAIAALEDTDFIKASKQNNDSGYRQLREGFAKLGLESHESDANFLLLKVENAQDAFVLFQKHGIILRPLGGYALPDYLE